MRVDSFAVLSRLGSKTRGKKDFVTRSWQWMSGLDDELSAHRWTSAVETCGHPQCVPGRPHTDGDVTETPVSSGALGSRGPA